MADFVLKIRWGALTYISMSLLLLLNIAGAILTVSNLPAAIFLIPLIVLDIMLAPIIRGIIISMFGLGPDLIMTQQGLTIKKINLPWHAVKSISLQTGRIMGDREYFAGCKLPALQKIFILDKGGREHECVIDIDYCMKGGRKSNNYLKITHHLSVEKRTQLMADWAEKR
jgi:hypothetical protein